MEQESLSTVGGFKIKCSSMNSPQNNNILNVIVVDKFDFTGSLIIWLL